MGKKQFSKADFLGKIKEIPERTDLAMKKKPLPVKDILKYSLVLLLVIGVFSLLSRKFQNDKGTLLDYEQARQESMAAEKPDNSSDEGQLHYNGEPSCDRVTYRDDFYYEPLSDDLISYITGISYPVAPSEAAEDSVNVGEQNEISYADLCYVHIIHNDFDGNLAEGELICNKYIAEDLLEIFYDLYAAGYQIEKVTLIENYLGDDTASMADNNTSCFNYRVVDGTSSLSKHALGLAIDINPLYNPYVRYDKKGGQTVSPAEGEAYADRSTSFPYKIDPDDLCYRLFTEHGFTWGGDWNSVKDYQHFQKALP